jgi:hypothetical protein
MELSQLLLLPGFWLGVAIFLWSQHSKFSELSSDSYGAATAASPLLKTLKARDLTNGSTFYLAFLTFLIVSLLIYLLICMIPQGVLNGALDLAGIKPISVDNSIYPIVIAFALVGVTQLFPWAGKAAAFQASIFHQWIGVPEKVLRTAADFSLQILARCDEDGMTDQQRSNALSKEIDNLLDDAWRNQVRNIVDPVFYGRQVSSLNLTSPADVAAVMAGSIREKRQVLQELVLAACVAAVRTNGGLALNTLAPKLGVTPVSAPATKKSATMGGLLVVGICTLVLIVVLPSGLARNLALGLIGTADFWPSTSYEAAQYVVANFLPFPIVAAILILVVDFNKIENRQKMGLFDMIGSSFKTLLLLFLAVIVYDYIQAFYDRGVFMEGFEGSVAAFMWSRLLLFSIHASGVAVCCLALITFLIRGNLGVGTGRILYQIATLVVIAAMAAYLSTIVRMQLFVGMDISGLALTWLVVGLNIASAVLTYALVAEASRRVGEAGPGGPDLPKVDLKPKAATTDDKDLGLAI